MIVVAAFVSVTSSSSPEIPVWPGTHRSVDGPGEESCKAVCRWRPAFTCLRSD